MKVPAAKLAVIAVLSLSSSSTVILSHSPSESSESVQRSMSQAEAQVPEVVLLRITAKYRIAREVIAGRLPLREAAALFGALNRVSPQDLGWRFGFPKDTDEAQLCRQVLKYMASALDEDPSREATVARFEADFKEEQRKQGRIRPPDPLTTVPVDELLAQARVELTDQGALPRVGKR